MSAAVQMSDEDIRRMAKRRVEFRQHAVTYVLVNLMLAVIWWFTTRGESTYWPVFSHVFWGVGLGFHAWQAYGTRQEDAVAREERKLREKYGKSP